MALFYSLILVLGCSLWTLVLAGKIEMGGFNNDFGSTGCVNDPTRKCINGKRGDICYGDRGLSFAISSGTASTCNACMPYNHRNIATYQDPHDLPCALWKYYDCDDVFVSHVWYKANSGKSNVCLDGNKSYNMNSWLGDAQQNEQEFIKACRTEQPGAFYGWPPVMKLITEKEFCLPLRNNVTSDQTSALSDYKEYYDNKYMNE